MKTKIKVHEIFKTSNRIIFDVIIEGKYLIDEIYSTSDNNLKFQLKGVGMDNNPNSETKSLLVEILSENTPVDDFKNKVFYKI